MKILITGRHLELRKDLKQYIRKRFGKWATFLAPDAEVHVILEVSGYRHLVEVTAQDGRYAVTGKQTTKDMYQSVDLLAEKINRQLARQHGKRTTVKTAAPRSRRVDPPARRPGDGPVIDIQPFAGKPMTADEAALQLHSARQPFLVFEDADTGQLAVLTKKKDGRLTLITKD